MAFPLPYHGVLEKFALGQGGRPEKKDAGRAEGTETASDVEISRKIEMPQVIEQSREIITELYVPMKGQVLDVGQSADEVLHPRPWGTAWPSIRLRAWYARRATAP